MNFANRNNRLLSRHNLAGTDILYCRDSCCSGHNRIDCFIWTASMASLPFHDGIKHIRRSHILSWPGSHLSHFQVRPSMPADNALHIWVFECPRLYNLSRPQQPLFSRLKNEFYNSSQLIPHIPQHFCYSHQNSCMSIMAAGVHNSGIFRGVGLSRLLRYGQGINIRPDGTHWSRIFPCHLCQPDPCAYSPGSDNALPR